MKKRGGVRQKRNRTFADSERTSADSERTSSIVSKEIIRPSFMEPLHGTKASKISTDGYTIDGPNTIFYAKTKRGLARFVVNTKRDQDQQFAAYDRFNRYFQGMQDYFIEQINTNKINRVLHDGQWICVTAGNGKWYESGSWEWSPKQVKWSDGDDTKHDEFVESPEGETAIRKLNELNEERTFCVPRNYEVILLTPPNAQVMALVSNYAP
jgi:hypothetical protein